MVYNIEIRPLATIEIIEAFDLRELQRPGLGSEFLDELEKFYTSLIKNPGIYTYYEKPVREGKVNRFP